MRLLLEQDTQVHGIAFKRTMNEVPPCSPKSRQPYNREAHEMLGLSVIPDGRSRDAWIAAAWKQA